MNFCELRLDWCSFDAAKFAVENWHYSRRMPSGASVKIGVWENEKFVGVVIFGRGATPEIGSPFGLEQTSICELVRVALKIHQTQVSRIIAIAIRLLKKQSAGLRLIVSFSDTAQKHHGGIYQAGGWVYVGSQSYHVYRVNGIRTHPKTLHATYGIGGQSIPWLRSHIDPNAIRIHTDAKHKYLMPLDLEMRKRIESLRKPYPKRAGSDTLDTLANHAGKGGSLPTPALFPNKGKDAKISKSRKKA